MEMPSTLTPERYAELREEAECLIGSIGWMVPFTAETEEERTYFWEEIVTKELGYDSCATCGTFCIANEMNYGDLCDDCWEEEEDSE
jgi:hypothetical protein